MKQGQRDAGTRFSIFVPAMAEIALLVALDHGALKPSASKSAAIGTQWCVVCQLGVSRRSQGGKGAVNRKTFKKEMTGSWKFACQETRSAQKLKKRHMRRGGGGGGGGCCMGLVVTRYGWFIRRSSEVGSYITNHNHIK
jgi:hypothetical protein